MHAAKVMDRNHVGMQQVGGRPGLGPELVAKPRLPLNQARVHDLERAGPPETKMLGLEYPGHRPAAQHRIDPVLSDPRPINESTSSWLAFSIARSLAKEPWRAVSSIDGTRDPTSPRSAFAVRRSVGDTKLSLLAAASPRGTAAPGRGLGSRDVIAWLIMGYARRVRPWLWLTYRCQNRPTSHSHRHVSANEGASHCTLLLRHPIRRE